MMKSVLMLFLMLEAQKVYAANLCDGVIEIEQKKVAKVNENVPRYIMENENPENNCILYIKITGRKLSRPNYVRFTFGDLNLKETPVQLKAKRRNSKWDVKARYANIHISETEVVVDAEKYDFIVLVTPRVDTQNFRVQIDTVFLPVEEVSAKYRVRNSQSAEKKSWPSSFTHPQNFNAGFETGTFKYVCGIDVKSPSTDREIIRKKRNAYLTLPPAEAAKIKRSHYHLLEHCGLSLHQVQIKHCEGHPARLSCTFQCKYKRFPLFIEEDIYPAFTGSCAKWETKNWPKEGSNLCVSETEVVSGCFGAVSGNNYIKKTKICPYDKQAIMKWFGEVGIIGNPGFSALKTTKFIASYRRSRPQSSCDPECTAVTTNGVTSYTPRCLARPDFMKCMTCRYPALSSPCKHLSVTRKK